MPSLKKLVRMGYYTASGFNQGLVPSEDPVPEGLLLQLPCSTNEFSDLTNATTALLTAGPTSTELNAIRLNQGVTTSEFINKSAVQNKLNVIGSGAWTIGFRMLAESFTNNTRIIQCGENGSNQSGFAVNFRGGVSNLGKLRFVIDGLTPQMNNNEIVAGKWYQFFLTGTGSGGTLAIYQDNVPISISSAVLPAYDWTTFDSSIFSIGGDTGASSGKFIIDDLRFYNRVLTGTEQQLIQDYNDLWSERDDLDAFYQCYSMIDDIRNHIFGSGLMSQWFELSRTPGAGSYPFLQATADQQPTITRLLETEFDGGVIGAVDRMTADRSQIGPNSGLFVVLAANTTDLSPSGPGKYFWHIGQEVSSGGNVRFGFKNGGYELDFNDGDVSWNIPQVSGKQVLTVWLPDGGTYGDSRFWLNGVEQTVTGTSNPTGQRTDGGGSLYLGTGFNAAGATRAIATKVRGMSLSPLYSEHFRYAVEGSRAWEAWGNQNPLDASHPHSSVPPKRGTYGSGSAFSGAFSAGFGIPWTPAYDEKAVVWYDPVNFDSVLRTGSTAVNTWEDVAPFGSGQDVSNALSSQQPKTLTRTISGKNAIEFLVNDRLSKTGFVLPSSGNFVIFMVAGIDAINNTSDSLWSLYDGAFDYDTQYSAGNSTQFDGDLQQSGLSFTGFSATGGPFPGPSIHACVFNFWESKVELWVDGTLRGSTNDYNQAIASSQKLSVFTNRAETEFPSGICGDFYITEDVNDDSVQRSIGWLAHKWGLAGNLPADHQYKNRPPQRG